MGNVSVVEMKDALDSVSFVVVFHNFIFIIVSRRYNRFFI